MLRAQAEKTLPRFRLGMLKGGGIWDVETRPRAVKYLSCLKREPAMEKVTEDLSWGVIAASEHLQGCWPDPPRGTASPELLLRHL